MHRIVLPHDGLDSNIPTKLSSSLPFYQVVVSAKVLMTVRRSAFSAPVAVRGQLLMTILARSSKMFLLRQTSSQSSSRKPKETIPNAQVDWKPKLGIVFPKTNKDKTCSTNSALPSLQENFTNKHQPRANLSLFFDPA